MTSSAEGPTTSAQDPEQPEPAVLGLKVPFSSFSPSKRAASTRTLSWGLTSLGTHLKRLELRLREDLQLRRERLFQKAHVRQLSPEGQRPCRGGAAVATLWEREVAGTREPSYEGSFLPVLAQHGQHNKSGRRGRILIFSGSE